MRRRPEQMQMRHLAVRTDKHALAPQGIDDGLAGGTGGCVINPGAEDVRNLLSRFGDQRLKAGDVLRVSGRVAGVWERRSSAVQETCWTTCARGTCRWRGRGATTGSRSAQRVAAKSP